ncbi:MAG: putative TBC1 domain family protein, partial [Streblomastix strix]
TREDYQNLKKKHIENLFQSDKNINSEGLETDNPLSHTEGSVWGEFFTHKELEEQIEKDLIRLFPDVSFFRNDEVLFTLRNMLVIYSLEHSTSGYQQGMHEILAIFFYILSQNCEDRKDESDENMHIIDFLMDLRYVEADSYTLFDRFMQNWYKLFTVRRNEQVQYQIDSSKQKPSTNIGLLSGSNDQSQENDETSVPDVVQVCRDVFHILQDIDSELHKQIQMLKIEPQIFLMRWIRMLFLREFENINAALRIWDAHFAEISLDHLGDEDETNNESDNQILQRSCGEIGLAGYVCISLLKPVRSEILSGNADYSSVALTMS